MPLQPLDLGYKREVRNAQSQVSEPSAFGAPLGGLNYTIPYQVEDAPPAASLLRNLIPRLSGVRLRPGYIQWTPAHGEPIKTIMPHATTAGASKLFTATIDGIYDSTTRYADAEALRTPVPATAGSGDWSYVSTSGLAGSTLAAVSPGPGFFTFDDANGWVNHPEGTQAGEIDGADPATFSFVSTWKNRLAFVEQNGSRLLFLDISASGGTVIPLEVGPMLKHGGHVEGFANWTLDGGTGIDDHLVIFGSEGDVIVYKGTDPTAADTIGLVGVWFAGQPPAGSRWWTQFGGGMALLTDRGLVPLAKLVAGGYSAEVDSLTATIDPALLPILKTSRGNAFWNVEEFPGGQLLMVTAPQTAQPFQYAMTTDARAFCSFDYPAAVMTPDHDFLWFSGATDGVLWQGFSGETDGVTLADVPGKDLEGELQTLFSPMGSAIQRKRFIQGRLFFIAGSRPATQAKINTDFSVAPVSGSPSFSPDDRALWDSALWDQAFWSQERENYIATVGFIGEGFYGALRMVMRGRPDDAFIGWHCISEKGGIL
jgi:hypothetical protein